MSDRYFISDADLRGLAADLLRGADVKVCTVISFPFGADTARTKVFGAEDAVARGADEIDVVINLPALLSGEFGAVRDELTSIVRAVRMKAINSGRGDVVVKTIIETCYLSNKMKLMACKICEQAGVDFVKTSTGVGPKGATVHDVELLRDCLDERIGVKASGGIRSYHDGILMLDSGADRLGASSSIAVISELLE